MISFLFVKLAGWVFYLIICCVDKFPISKTRPNCVLLVYSNCKSLTVDTQNDNCLAALPSELNHGIYPNRQKKRKKERKYTAIAVNRFICKCSFSFQQLNKMHFATDTVICFIAWSWMWKNPSEKPKNIRSNASASRFTCKSKVNFESNIYWNSANKNTIIRYLSQIVSVFLSDLFAIWVLITFRTLSCVAQYSLHVESFILKVHKKLATRILQSK